MVEKIGALVYKASMISSHRLDEALDQFLTKLLDNLWCTLGHKTRRVAYSGIGAFTTLDDSPQPIEHFGARRWWRPFRRTNISWNFRGGFVGLDTRFSLQHRITRLFFST